MVTYGQYNNRIVIIRKRSSREPTLINTTRLQIKQKHVFYCKLLPIVIIISIQ